MKKKTTGLVALEGGALGLSEGVLSLIRPALLLLEPGGELSLRSTAALTDDLGRWCEVQHHVYLGAEPAGEKAFIHRIRRGPFPRLQSLNEKPSPEAPAHSGFALREVRFEVGAPPSGFRLNTSEVSPPNVQILYQQAIKNQWNAERDIAWKKLKPLPREMDAATVQIMTFLAENEISALYLPSRYISHIHPYFVLTSQFLATQLVDEARHIEAFTRRANAGKATGVSCVVTAQSLLSLLDAKDFLEASFLLSVLGEGTFLDLLTFIEKNAPDEVTESIVARAKEDESRHVHFGIAHVNHAIQLDPAVAGRLKSAVESRAHSISSLTGAPEPLMDALVLMGAGSASPAALRVGVKKYQDLLETMEKNRIKRLKSAGFSASLAQEISRLHTPNFM